MTITQQINKDITSRDATFAETPTSEEDTFWKRVGRRFGHWLVGRSIAPNAAVTCAAVWQTIGTGESIACRNYSCKHG